MGSSGESGIYRRGNKLSIWFYNAKGEREWASTGLNVGQEKEAQRLIEKIEREVLKEKKTGIPAGKMTNKRFGEEWIEQRQDDGVESADDEATHLRLHAWPLIGDTEIEKAHSDHMEDMVRALKKKVSERTGEKLAPRTIRHVTSTLHTMFEAAIRKRYLTTNPIANMDPNVLPAFKDADPQWRPGAVFIVSEVEQIISDERVPWDRRVAHAMLFLAGLRHGESAALRWRDYETKMEPLGRFTVAESWNSRKKKRKETKTEVWRWVPVHPTLAKILAAWKLGGWEKTFGRPPREDDLIVPSRTLRPRLNSYSLKLFHEDLDELGLRRRRQHDARRTFISEARRHGARLDILRWITHGPSEDIMDDYTSFPHQTLCEQVLCVKVELREGGRLLQLQAVGAESCDSDCDSNSGPSEFPKASRHLGPTFRTRSTGLEAIEITQVSPNLTDPPETNHGDGDVATDPHRSIPEQAVTDVTDPIGEALGEAHRDWSVRHDKAALIERLKAILVGLSP